MIRIAIAVSLALLLSLVPKQEAFSQQRVKAQRFVVASGHPAATEAGLEVLRNGGNAMDAAVVTSLCMGVAAPYGSGVGGKLVMLYREAATGKIYCIQAICVSPAKLDPQKFIDLSFSERLFGYQSACIPGLPAGLWEAHERWGSQEWKGLVTKAADLAREGVPMTAALRETVAPEVKQLREDPEAAKIYLVNGKTPPVGAVMRYTALARTLDRLARGGAKEFYEGETAERIVTAARAHGSPLTKQDLKNYRPRFTRPISISYHGNRVYSCPAPQIGGVTVLLALKALEESSWKVDHPRDATYINTMGRILRTVYPTVVKNVADVPTADLAARNLLRLGHFNASSFKKPVEASEPAKKGEDPDVTLDDMSDASTSHLIVADSEGNVVSLTQSLSFHFGAHVVVPGTGILLNNSMSNFTVTSPKSLNYVGPGKSPRSTVAPIIVTREDKPTLALGIPGGQRIPTTTLQLIVDVLDFQRPLASAFKEPRFHIRRPLTSREKTNIVDIEGEPSAELHDQLVDQGWKLVAQRADGRYFGGGNAVQYRTDGTLLGVADLRRANLADGE